MKQNRLISEKIDLTWAPIFRTATAAAGKSAMLYEKSFVWHFHGAAECAEKTLNVVINEKNIKNRSVEH